MKLDRNINPSGRGKYALVLMRNLPQDGAHRREVLDAFNVLLKHEMLDYGEVGTEREFFLMRLRDVHAHGGLKGYHASVMAVPAQVRDVEYAKEIFEMVLRSGPLSPFCKTPD